MIGSITGVVAVKTPPVLLIETHGIGYEVHASLTTFAEVAAVGSQVRLVTHFVVREDAQLLYGFSREEERKLFRAIIKVSGVGPKLALAILSGMDVKGFNRCILANDIKSLTQLPGVGKKTAERLVIEMKDRLPELQHENESGQLEVAAENTAATMIAEAETALVTLGYKPTEASKAIARIDSEAIDTAEELIRAALQGMISK